MPAAGPQFAAPFSSGTTGARNLPGHGSRPAGCCRAHPHEHSGARLCYRKGKTGQEADLPILSELAAELALLPPGQMMLLAHGEQAKPYKPETLANCFKDRCVEAGLPHCSAHGLRKAGARRLAAARATEFEVMSFLAHRTAKEASRYTAAANCTKLTTSGMAKLAPEGLSNPLRRLDKNRG